MTVQRMIRIVAGTFVLASLALGWFVSPYFYLFTAFVGLNLLQSGITKWCLMEDILKKLGMPGECKEDALGQGSESEVRRHTESADAPDPARRENEPTLDG